MAKTTTLKAMGNFEIEKIEIEISLLVLENGSCEHTTNDLPTFSPQKRNLEIGPSERLLLIFGTNNRILKNRSCERAFRSIYHNPCCT